MKPLILYSTFALTAMINLSCASCTSEKINNSMNDKTDVYKILHYASLAGSSHNSQPWRVEVYPNDSLTVYADTTRLLKVVDLKGIEMLISVGAFIENLDIAATALGYDAEITLVENSMNSASTVAGIRLRKNGSAQNSELLKELELRTTLRIPFDTLDIKEDDWEKLVALSPGNIHFIPSSSAQGVFIANKELEAYTIQAFQKEAQDELANWMRFSNKDVNTKRDGLTPAGMGIKGIAGFFVRNFMKPEDSKKESFIQSGVDKTKKQVENCGGWILITTEKYDNEEWINIGRIYERLNIACRSLNIGFHPMNQIVEVPQIYKELSENILQGKEIRFAARIGYVSDFPAPVSKRRPVEAFTVFH